MTYTAIPQYDHTDAPLPEPIPYEEAIKTYYRSSPLIRVIQRFIQSTPAEAFAGITLPVEKVQYKNNHKSMKAKGGHPPVDFSLVEKKIDLELALREEDYETALGLYFYLRRAISGD